MAQVIERSTTVNYQDDSPEAVLRLEFDRNYALLLLATGGSEDVERARVLLHEIDKRIGFDAEASGRRLALFGDRRMRILTNLGITFNKIGEHRKAIKIDERMLERAQGARNPARAHLKLNNLVGSWLAEGYVCVCRGDVVAAKLAYEHATDMLRQSNMLGDDHLIDADAATREANELIRSSLGIRLDTVKLGLELEQGHVDDVFSRLDDLRARAEELVDRSDANPVVLTADAAARYSRLGDVHLEFARAGLLRSGTPVRGYAANARVFYKFRHDLQGRDGDAPASLIVDYGDACLLSGDDGAARRVYSHGLARLELRCGPAYAPCERLRDRLRRLDV